MIRRALLLLLLAWLLGFVYFAMWLPQPMGAYRTDAIVAFTGGPGRIDRALGLLADGQARRLLISGVDPQVKRAELAATYRRPPAVFDCCVTLGREAVDTRSNGTEIAQWVRRNGYRSVRLVTTDWHMPRARWEVERLLPDNIIVITDAVPSRPSLRTLWVEYHKYLLRRMGALLGL